MSRHSAITGFTFPGMIDDPGCTGGRLISARPVAGPDARRRRSFAMRISSSARERRDSRHRSDRLPALHRLVQVLRRAKGHPGLLRQLVHDPLPEPGRHVQPRAGPRSRPSGRLHSSRDAATPSRTVRRRAAPYAFISRPSRTGTAILQVRPARLHHARGTPPPSLRTPPRGPGGPAPGRPSASGPPGGGPWVGVVRRLRPVERRRSERKGRLSRVRPSSSSARLASTSFRFMFRLVPAPAWNGSRGNCPACRPAITSTAAAAMAPAFARSSPPTSPFASAAARFTRA